jgi:2-polyprenyl-3-methyl-5-hydroxy-6-metoxy-1,4-benzoquinol methylase
LQEELTKKHWNNVYETKAENEVSWFQEIPKRSLETILSLNLPKSAEIIDIGGGESKLAQCLYENSFHNLTVLDISHVALEKLTEKLNALFTNNKIQTIASNIVDAQFNKQFDVWHDRAVFHFLTNPEDQKKYVALLMKSLAPNGYFLISTFSHNGPKKCSGLDICQYDKDDLVNKFSELKLIDSGSEDHTTPFHTTQNFTYCLFQKVQPRKES